MEVREGRSPRYVCSLDPQSCVDMEILEALKRSVKAINAGVEWEQTDWGPLVKVRKRVRVKGREAIEKINDRSYNWAGDILGGLENAKRFDVYIHDDRKYKYE